MKIKKLVTDRTELVNYFGVDILVPLWAEYLACDSNGALYAYTTHPTPIEDLLGNGGWTPYYEHLFEQIAVVDLEGLDWKETLKEI